MQPLPHDDQAAKLAQSSARRRSRRSELLKAAVMATVIVVVVAIFLPVGGSHHNVPRSETKLMLKSLTMILDKYRTTTSRIPPDINSFMGVAATMPSLSPAVANLPAAGAVTRGAGGSCAVHDGFGNPIILVNTPGNPRSPYFQSAGPDGILGTADDMFSYDP
jgi:hypothetical protein